MPRFSSEPEKKKAAAPAPVEEPVPVKKKKAAPVTEVPEVPVVAEAPEQKPVKKAEKKSKKKKNSRKGSAVFSTFYIMLVLVLAAGSFLGYRWLEGWLTEYEAAQVKCQEMFQELFADPDWGALYERAGIQDTLFEGKDAYIAHMQSKVGFIIDVLSGFLLAGFCDAVSTLVIAVGIALVTLFTAHQLVQLIVSVDASRPY